MSGLQYLLTALGSLVWQIMVPFQSEVVITLLTDMTDVL